MRKFFLLVLGVCMVALADASRIAVGRGTPEVDGALADDVWKNAIAAGPFLVDQQNAFATQQTVVRFSVYSGYQSERTKLIYGIDWTLLDGKVDFMMCGYGRNEKDLHATQEASRVSRLVTGELVLPDDISQNTAPGWIQKATLLRRCCDATGGYLVFAYASLDGRSFLAMAEVSRILRRFEPFFMTGRRRPEALTVSGLGAEEYEVLDDAGNSLVALMNGKKENRDFAFEIPIPEGKKLYDADGNAVACPVKGVLPADGIAIYVVR